MPAAYTYADGRNLNYFLPGFGKMVFLKRVIRRERFIYVPEHDC